MKPLALILVLLVAAPAFAVESQRLYLSGTDKDHTVNWDFFCTAGRNSDKWTTIPVPSNWEFQGFGHYWYGTDKPAKGDSIESGRYRHRFTLPPGFTTGKRVFLVFEGSMTDTEAWLNGQTVGPKHQGSFYRFEYDVTALLKPGAENLLEVTVDKHSADESVNRAERQSDYWLAGGIYRPVYLKVVPDQYLDRIAADARADGSLTVHVFPGQAGNGDTIDLELYTRDMKKVGPTLTAPATGDEVVLKGRFDDIAPWTAETPNLYELRVTLKSAQTALHTLKQRIGFRTIEVRPGKGIYLNGTRILLKGVCRHSFWPDSGRCLSPAQNEADVKLIKQMNCNAVRMSHYPPDVDFLDRCDELGLYVLDELGGWQKSYSTEIGRKLIAEMVPRDVNHPSILFWDNGNEGGWNTANDDQFARWDPQQRSVLHPWALHDHVNTKHYPTWAQLEKLLAGPDLVMPTECLHGLFDGGIGAGMADYWPAIRKSPVGAGMFFWVFADEGARRVDENNRIDVFGNRAPDGVVGPYHQKEASFYTVRKLWSPIIITPHATPFDGLITVENRYDFTSLGDCSLRIEPRAYALPDHAPDARSVGSAKLPLPAVAPGESLRLTLPPIPAGADAVAVTAVDSAGRDLNTWVFPLHKPGYYRQQLTATGKGTIAAKENGDALILSAGGTTATFSRSTGRLVSLAAGGTILPLTNGPRLTVDGGKLATFTHAGSADGDTVEATFDGPSAFTTKWTLLPSGWLRLDYTYAASGKFDFLGITFDFPESTMRSHTWLGDGPYRVWQNRLDGPTLGLWHTDYNQTLTGHSVWKYPEFRGYFNNVRWSRLTSSSGSLLTVLDEPSLYWRIGTDQTPAKLWMHAVETFPPGDLSILHAIPAIGNKFQPAKAVGPESQPFVAKGRYAGTVFFKPEPR